MGTKLLDSVSESPTEMTLGTKSVVLLPSRGEIGNSLNYFPSCPVSFTKREEKAELSSQSGGRKLPRCPPGAFLLCVMLSLYVCFVKLCCCLCCLALLPDGHGFSEKGE